MDVNEFGRYIKSLRKEKKLTLIELSELSDVSHPYLSQIENGKRGIPSPDILNKLADPLGVSYAELMIQAGYIDELLGRMDPDNPVHEFKRTLNRAMKWLHDNGDFNQVAKKNIEYYLEINNVTSITIDNLFEKLEEFVNRDNWDDLMDSGEDLIYYDLFDILERLTESKQLNNQNLDAIIAHSKPLTYNGHVITDNDRKLIMSYLDALFSNRN
ncbi:helix-turn-helix domain-containing protein [Paenibacillus lautus]|uniref:helix-turn-helix domain-containing protein n=1 Tax=Paenibacillus lautus TaxID=1401 RepID=UPI003D2B8FCD